MLFTGKNWAKESALGLLTPSFLLAFVMSAHCADAPADLIPKLKPVPACAALAAAAQSNQIDIGHIDSTSGTNALNPGDSAAVLVTFFQNGNQTQWLLYLEAVAPGPKDKTKKSTLKLTPGSGDPITFESEPTPAKLRLLGPFGINNTSPPPKHRVADTRISLEKDFLGLGLDQAAALALKWDQKQGALIEILVL